MQCNAEGAVYAANGVSAPTESLTGASKVLGMKFLAEATKDSVVPTRDYRSTGLLQTGCWKHWRAMNRFKRRDISHSVFPDGVLALLKGIRLKYPNCSGKSKYARNGRLRYGYGSKLPVPYRPNLFTVTGVGRFHALLVRYIFAQPEISARLADIQLQMFGLVWSGLRSGKLSHRLPKKFHAKTNKRKFERQIAASERRRRPTGSTFDGACAPFVLNETGGAQKSINGEGKQE
ncbi:hypothetical protein B0H13DRAFT_1850534 [Mycena leptocephala]|nr:hypothetical protein B0H13DRAFT_1850534 [Mycena leptocephala]